MCDTLALSLVIIALLAGSLARVSPRPGRQRGRFFSDSSAFIPPRRDAEVSSILHHPPPPHARCNKVDGAIAIGRLGLLVFAREGYYIKKDWIKCWVGGFRGDGVSLCPDFTAGSARPPPLPRKSRQTAHRQPVKARLHKSPSLNSVISRSSPTAATARPPSPLYLPWAKDKSITYTSTRHSISVAPQAPLPACLALGILKAPLM